MLPKSSQTSHIWVEVSDRRYPIEIGSGAFDSIAAKVQDRVNASHIVLVVDANVVDPWARRLGRELWAQRHSTPAASLAHDDAVRVDVVEVPAGEPSKSIGQFQRVLDSMLAGKTDRQSVVVALGGGVIGDLAGFAAASYARGLRFVQVPTTLLAMVDSSVGGKTGINLADAKNMVGAFWQPQAVFIETDVLSTLGQREYQSGLAEVIKYGVIDDAEFFAWFEQNIDALIQRDAAALRHAIATSCRAKAGVVGRDERETGDHRVILNYGHTFAHAIEKLAGYGEVLHGEAVAIGMQMAGRLADSLGILDDDLIPRQTRLLQQAGLPISRDVDADAMLAVMATDKKVAHGKLRFVLPTRIGHVKLVGDIPAEHVRAAVLES